MTRIKPKKLPTVTKTTMFLTSVLRLRGVAVRVLAKLEAMLPVISAKSAVMSVTVEVEERRRREELVVEGFGYAWGRAQGSGWGETQVVYTVCIVHANLRVHPSETYQDLGS